MLVGGVWSSRTCTGGGVRVLTFSCGNIAGCVDDAGVAIGGVGESDGNDGGTLLSP